MIPDKIKDLFQFIDFLHSNIDEFKKHDKLLSDLRFLKDERINILPVKNYKEKIKFDELQSKISNKIAPVKLSIIEPIVEKINNLNLCELENEKTLWEWNVKDVEEFHYNFKIEDIPKITKQKNKYITFRTEINEEIYLLLRYFFNELDKLLKYLFEFFTVSNSNEFDFMKFNILNNELFEIADKLIIDAIDLIGSEKYNAPKDRNKAREVYKAIQDVTFFEIYFETVNEKEYNYDSILTPDNWEQHKDIFFNQRMETYPESYTKGEKIKLELEGLEKLTIDETDYKILKERYEQYLINQTEEAEQETQPLKESDTEHTEAIRKLKTIWLAEPKLTVEDFIQKGIDKGLWNESLRIITIRKSLYGTGKTLLSSVYFAFKDWAISINIDYKEVGKVFCEVFNIEIKETTKEPYKAFSSGNPKIITEMKRTFGVK